MPVKRRSPKFNTPFLDANGFVSGEWFRFLTTEDYWESSEMAAEPEAPAAGFGRIYFRDNGAGKTQLVVKFNTGAVQVLATEP